MIKLSIALLLVLILAGCSTLPPPPPPPIPQPAVTETPPAPQTVTPQARLYTPMVCDISSGKITAAAEPTQGSSMPRRIIWSGQGFWIDPLVHFGIDGRLDANVQLRQALTPQGWDLVAAEVSPDGRLVVAALDRAGASASPVDLVVASRDGNIISRMPAALPAVHYNRGIAGEATWNPAGTAVVTEGRISEYRLDGSHVDYGDIGSQVILGWLPDGRIVLLVSLASQASATCRNLVYESTERTAAFRQGDGAFGAMLILSRGGPVPETWDSLVKIAVEMDAHTSASYLWSWPEP